MKQHIKSAVALSMAFMTMMPVMSYADAAHDATEDRSSDTATVTVGKVLTVNQDGRFPKLSDYKFEVQAIKGWDNANASASENGKDISASAMPMPTQANAEHHKVNVDGTTASVTVGDFVSGNATTDKADTQREKLRTTDLNIRFSKAGYYMYKIHEVYDQDDRVPGVAYDDNNYYVVIYVCNKTDKDGNTIDGVYVHDITSYRNDPESDVQPDLSDIANVTDNGGTAAIENTYYNFEKVGRSVTEEGEDPETGIPVGPNKLEAYKFWNDQTTHDIVLTNNVTGNLGDISKKFEFDITLHGLEKGATYDTTRDADEKTTVNHTSEGVTLIAGGNGTVDPAAGTFTADDNGDASFTVKLKDDEVFVMNSLPATSTYAVNELASDHIASYEISSTREDTAVIEKESDANVNDRTALATATETVDGVSNVADRRNSDDNDGTVTIAYSNHRNLATITGVPYYGNAVFVAIAALVMSLLAVLGVRRRKNPYEEDFE